MDPADPTDAFDAGWLLLDGHALGDELADGAANLFVVAPEEARPLRAREHAAVGTGERDPLSPPSSPAEGFQRLRAFLQVAGRFARRRVEPLLLRVHARNGGESLAPQSTREQRPLAIHTPLFGSVSTTCQGPPGSRTPRFIGTWARRALCELRSRKGSAWIPAIHVRFSRFRGTVQQGPVERQETQIVQSRKTLDDFLRGIQTVSNPPTRHASHF